MFQQANTNDLLQDCKSVKTIFNVTSAAGATSSLTKAKTDWKIKADDDLLYYNTYLKPHPLTYKTAAGLQTNNVSMRQCHVIFMLDNLVKKKSLYNPARGECESQHMCTIPITLDCQNMNPRQNTGMIQRFVMEPGIVGVKTETSLI